MSNMTIGSADAKGRIKSGGRWLVRTSSAATNIPPLESVLNAILAIDHARGQTVTQKSSPPLVGSF